MSALPTRTTQKAMPDCPRGEWGGSPHPQRLHRPLVQRPAIRNLEQRCAVLRHAPGWLLRRMRPVRAPDDAVDMRRHQRSGEWHYAGRIRETTATRDRLPRSTQWPPRADQFHHANIAKLG